MIKEKFISKIVTLFSLLLILYACNAEDDGTSTRKQGSGFDIGSTFVRLMDDSTKTAGYLDITANTPELKLKWNTLPTCNIDTTITTVKVSGGKYRLPIKWDKLQKDSLYGPSTKAFEAGVTISDGVQSKYVQLFWTDGIDSTQIVSEVMTRSGDEEREVIMLELLPTEDVIMDKDIGGAVYVNFSGTAIVRLDPSNITNETNIDKSILPKLITKPQEVDFEWIDGLAPKVNFVKLVRFSASTNVYKDAVVIYNVPPVINPKYEFKSSLPADGGLLPATDANVSVTVNTNMPWSIESDLGVVPSMSDYDAGILSNRNLILPIQANTGSTQRTVTVIVKSQGIAKDTLTFTQLAPISQGTEFTFISADPANNATIPSTGATATVKVNTDYEWWIQLDGAKTTFPAGALGEKTGTVSIPANTTTTSRNVSYIIGYGETTVQTITYSQPAAGMDNTLECVGSNLPTGNIPATATVYTFNFEGGYTGQFRVRSVDATTGTVLFNGPIGTTHSPKVTVPANTDTNPRNIKFQYRLIDIPGSPWEDLLASTNRIQDGGTGGGNIEASATLTPSGNIPEDGDTYTCTFTGGSGNVILRAMKKRVNSSTWTEAVRSGSTTVPGNVSVTVPELSGLNATISFEYSTDGGNTWNTIDDNRNQVNTWILIDYPDRETIVAATNGSISFGLRGNVKQPITIYVRHEGREIGRATGYAPGTLIVPVEDNPSSSSRYIFFSHQTIDGEAWVSDKLIQAGK